MDLDSKDPDAMEVEDDNNGQDNNTEPRAAEQAGTTQQGHAEPQEHKSLSLAQAIQDDALTTILALLRTHPELGQEPLLDDNCRDTVLTRVARLGKLEMFKRLVAEAGLDPTQGKLAGPITDDWMDGGAPPVCIAAYRGHLQLVEWLVKECGCGVESTDDDAATILHHAAWAGHADIVKLLVTELGANREARDVHGRTPLSGAVWRGHMEIIRLLVAQGADVNSRDQSGCTALSLAAERGDVAVVRALAIELGAKVDSVDESGSTALFDAAWNDKLDVVQCLVTECGCNVNQADNQGKTAIYYAAQQHSHAVVAFLAEANAQLSGKLDSKVWKKPLVLAALENGVQARERRALQPHLTEALFEPVKGMERGAVDIVGDYALSTGWWEIVASMGVVACKRRRARRARSE
eukprot:g56495.t1